MYEKVTSHELATVRGPRASVVAAQDALLFLYAGRGVSSLGIYNRRASGSSALKTAVSVSNASLHAAGRALDLAMPNQQVGNELFLRLIRAFPWIGLGEIIWWDQRYTSENGPQPYHGVDNHHTHIHLGFTTAWAENASSHDDLCKWVANSVLYGTPQGH